MRGLWFTRSMVATAILLVLPAAARADLSMKWAGGTHAPQSDPNAPLPAGVPASQEHECECGICVHPMRKLYSKRTYWIVEGDWYPGFGTSFETWHFSSAKGFANALQSPDVTEFGGTWLYGVHYDTPDHPDPGLHTCGQALVNIHGGFELDSEIRSLEMSSTSGFEASASAKASSGSKTGQGEGTSSGTEVGVGGKLSGSSTVRVVQGVPWRTRNYMARYAECTCGTQRPSGGPPTTTNPKPGGGGGSGGPSEPTAPQRPTTAPTQAGRVGRGGSDGPKAPAGPTEPTPPNQPKAGDTASTASDTATLDALVNTGTIGAGDTFATSITVADAKTAHEIRSGLESGDYVLTQNGVPVEAKVTPTPQHVTAFAQDPATTVFVTSTVMPAKQREVTMNLERRTPSGTTEVVGSTTMLTQSKAVIFQDQGTGQVRVVVTGTETPWGDADPKFELQPNSDPAAVGTPNDIATKQGEGSTIWTVLKGAGFTLAMTAGGVIVAELLKGDDGVPPAPPSGNPAPARPAGAGFTPTGPGGGSFADDVNNAYTPTGHNSVPTGYSPTPGTPVITSIGGSAGVVPNPNSDLSPASGAGAFVPAVTDGDWTEFKIEDVNPWATPIKPEQVAVTIFDGGAPVASPPVGDVTVVDGALMIAVLFESFNFTDSHRLSVACTIEGKQTPQVPFTTILTATPLTAAQSTVSGGIVNVDVRIEGCGQAEQWVMTWQIDAANVTPLQEVVFGEGSGVFTFGFKGDGIGVANLRPSIRRVDE